MEEIIIRKNPEGAFDVIQGEKYADHVTWHEMVGLVSAMTIPSPARELEWMKTKEQHQALRDSWKQIDQDL